MQNNFKITLNDFLIETLQKNVKKNLYGFGNLDNYKRYYIKEQTAPGLPSSGNTGAPGHRVSPQANPQPTQPTQPTQTTNQPQQKSPQTNPQPVPVTPNAQGTTPNPVKPQTKHSGGPGLQTGSLKPGRSLNVPANRREGMDAILGVGADGSGGLDSLIKMYAAGKAAETGGNIASALGGVGGRALGGLAQSGTVSGGLATIGGGILTKLGDSAQIAAGEIGKALGTQWVEKNIANTANAMQQAYAQDAGSPVGMLVPGPTKYTSAADKAEEAEEKQLRTMERQRRMQELRGTPGRTPTGP